MMGEEDRLYDRNLFLLTLRGRVTVHFVDSSTLAGELAAQDELQVFLRLEEGETVMIPRGQIRYIKGQADQPIEQDVSQTVFQAVPAEEVEPAAVQAIGPEIELEGTIVLKPEPEAARAAELPPEPAPASLPVDTDSTGVTVILEDPSLLAEVQPETPAAPAIEPNEATFIVEPGPPRQPRTRLICTGGPHAGDVFELSTGITTIGRSSDNAIALNRDKEVSRRHAIIIQEGDKYFIQDQNSLNGTFVNDDLVKGSRYLQENDVVLVGLSTLEYHQA